MDILRKNPEGKKEEQIKNFFSREEEAPEEVPPEESFLDRYGKEIIIRWQTKEFETYERSQQWYAVMALFLIAIIGYSVYMNSPVVAIVFILIGMLGYIHLNKEPRILDFAITDEGIIAGKELYEFENMHSFWIFYNPPQEKIISFHSKGYLLPFVHVPLGSEDPLKIRELLLNYLPEIKQKPSLADALERLLGL